MQSASAAAANRDIRQGFNLNGLNQCTNAKGLVAEIMDSYQIYGLANAQLCRSRYIAEVGVARDFQFGIDDADDGNPVMGRLPFVSTVFYVPAVAEKLLQQDEAM